MSRIVVLGAGSWGAALARLLSVAGHEVTLWGHRDLSELARTRRHKNLPGMELPASLGLTSDISVCAEAEFLLLVTPSLHVRETVRRAAPYLRDGQVLISASKGVEKDSLLTMSEVMEQELPGKDVSIVALSGPSHAEEVALDQPTAIVSASRDADAAAAVQALFAGTCLRVYTNDDILGVELCGAVKNIIALASGINTGAGFGDNTRAALLTRGMAEIRRLGVSLGCREETFAGLAGIGDLIVTATSLHSRNYRCGVLIGQGFSPVEAVETVGMVVEGVNALPGVLALARRQGVEMPITEGLNRVVFANADVRREVLSLMARDSRSELEK